MEQKIYGLIGKNIDYSFSQNYFNKKFEIEPFQVVDFKVNYHKEFIKKWLIENDIKFTFDEIWTIREQCI